MDTRQHAMHIILGLGNPGQTYRDTRHNVGFRVIQILEHRYGVQVQQRLVSPLDGRPAGVYGDSQAGGQTIRLLMPLTMMNESGDALRALAPQPGTLLIVCDDVNLPFGTLRLRASGSAGGHHGLASCVEVLGTEEVARLRLGVGVADLPKDLRDFVLSPFTPGEQALATQMIEQAADACDLWARNGLDAAMNRYNGTPVES